LDHFGNFGGIAFWNADDEFDGLGCHITEDK